LGGDCDIDEHPRWNLDNTHHGFDEFGFNALPGGGDFTNNDPDYEFDHLRFST